MKKRMFTYYRLLFQAMFVALLTTSSLNVFGQAVPDNKRYLGLSLINEGDDPQLALIQKAKDSGLNSVLLSIQWGTIHGYISRMLKQENGASYNVWSQYDAQIAKARELGMKVAINVVVSTGDDVSGGTSDRYGVTTGDGWLKQERILNVGYYGQEAVFQRAGGGAIRPNVYLQFVMTSLAAQSTKTRISDFAREVTQRYKYLQNTNELLYMDLIWSRTGEGDFDIGTDKFDNGVNLDMSESISDYSQPMVSAYRSWIQNKYTSINNLNSQWGTNYTSFGEVNPKRPPASTFTGADGNDWFLFRTQVLRETNELFSNTVKSEDSRIKVILQNGSVFDKLSLRRSTFSFNEFGSNLDGIKINDAPSYDHRFAVDLVRTNLPGKLIVNESEYNYEGIGRYLSLATESFTHGAKVVSMFQFEAAWNAGHQNAIKSMADTWVNNQSVTTPTPSNNNSFTLSSMISTNGCETTNRTSYSQDCDAYKNWNTAYSNAGNQPVNIFIQNDLLPTNCPQVSATSSNYNPTVGTSITLSANCSGACSGVSYSWSGTGVSNVSGQTPSITVPSTAGSYTYTVTTSKSGCTNTTSTVSITVVAQPVSSSCYELSLASNNKRISNANYNGTSVLKVKDSDNSDSQIWKIEDAGSGYVKLISQGSTIGANVGYALSVQNQGSSLSNLVDIQPFTGGDHQLWTQTALTGADAGRYKFLRKNTAYNIGSARNYGSGNLNDAISDISLESDPGNVYGSNKIILIGKTCPGTSTPDCNFTVSASASNTAPSVNASISLNAGCSGTGCASGVSYSWSGTGVSNVSGQTPSITVPSTAGSYTYTVTTSKSGCTNTTSTVSITVVAQPVSSSCYELSLASNNKRISNANYNGTSVLKVKDSDNSDSQIWKIEDAGSGYVKLISQGSTIGANVGYALSVQNQGSSLSNLVDIQPFTGGDHQLWTQTALTGADAGRYKFLRKNTAYNIGSARNYGSGNLNDAISDISLESDPGNVYGSNKIILIGKTCPGTSTPDCNFTVSASASNTAPSVNASISLNAGCSGTGCASGVSYSWSGTGVSNVSGQTPSITVPSTAGSYTYTVTASKTGCTTKTASVSITVVAGGGSTAFNQCIESESSSGNGAITSDPNASNGQTRGEENNYNHYVDYSVSNVPSSGTYYVKLQYYSSAAPTVNVQVNGSAGQSVNLANSGSWNIGHTEQTISVNLNAGSNTIRIQGTGGGSCRQDKICVSNSQGNARIAVFKDTESTVESRDLVASPNPSTGDFDVNFYLEKGQPAKLSVINMLGISLFSKDIYGNGQHHERITLEHLTSGTFILEVRGTNSLQVKRIVIVR